MKTKLIGIAALIVLTVAYVCIGASFSDWEKGLKIVGTLYLLGFGAWLLIIYLERTGKHL